MGDPDGSFSSKHTDRSGNPILVGPATDDQKNAIRPDISPVACWRLDDIRFQFDSCFVAPESNPDFRLLASLLKEHPKAPLSIFGHADPVGTETYNKQLSGRRAMAVYAILIRDVDTWERLYTADHWGNPQLLAMLDSLGYSPAAADGLHTGAASDALKQFQDDNGLTGHGYVNAPTRKKLFLAYMNRLCGPGMKLKKTDFLAQGADNGGRGDYQGCGEFNPLVLLSKEENDYFSKQANHTQRNAVNAPNRRVMIFLFRAGTKVDPGQWPCPKADTTAIAGCEARFWSDGRNRLKNTEARRTYSKDHNTFACRFYDRLSNFSPCESTRENWVLRILTAGHGSIPSRRPLANEPFILSGTGSGTGEIRGRTDQNGVLRATVGANAPTMILKIAGMTLTVMGGTLHPIGEDGAVKDRLYNLGYGDRDFDAWTDATLSDAVKAFQKDHQLSQTGDADADTKQKLREMHGS